MAQDLGKSTHRTEATMNEPVFYIVGWLLLHGGALSAAWGTRILAGSDAEGLVQVAFLLTMGGVGSTAWLCYHLQSELWILSAVTLIVMVLAAISDFGSELLSDSTARLDGY